MGTVLTTAFCHSPLFLYTWLLYSLCSALTYDCFYFLKTRWRLRNKVQGRWSELGGRRRGPGFEADERDRERERRMQIREL